MRVVVFTLLLLSSLLAACAPAHVPVTGAEPSAPAAAQPSRGAGQLTASRTSLPTSRATTAPSATATLTPRPSATRTPTPPPAGIIQVDTLEQEVYPFPQNGNCSLAEAITAANLLRPVDGCAAGVENQTVIELMPGTYRLTRMDTSPQQVEWAVHTDAAGSALPPVARVLTLRGNGAVLSREDAAEPFRILEILYGSLITLEDITFQGGDAGETGWGGGVLVQNASAHLSNVQFFNNRAENGGGMYLSNGGLTVRDSLFQGNEAYFSGGGLYVDTAKIEISGTRFLENRNDGVGAGFFAERITLLLTDSIFIGNTNAGTHGGGLSIAEAEATILRSQFYRNVTGSTGGGASFRNYIYEDDIAEAEADPMLMLENSEFYQQYATMIPGFRETLVAQPSGQFQAIKLKIEIHDSCFKNNVTHFPGDPNWASAIGGVSLAQNNYYGHPSGPGGMGPGIGDMVGKKVEFEPFLAAPPPHCDLSLAK